MKKWINRSILMSSVVGLALTSCGLQDATSPEDDVQQTKLPLFGGEPKLPFQASTFSPEHELIPTDVERKMMNLLNRNRAAPVSYGGKESDAKQFAIYVPELVHSRNWFNRYSVALNCNCAPIKNDPDLDAFGRACHKLSLINNVLRPYEITKNYNCRDQRDIVQRTHLIRNAFYQRGLASVERAIGVTITNDSSNNGQAKRITSSQVGIVEEQLGTFEDTDARLAQAFLTQALINGNSVGIAYDYMPAYVSKNKCYFPETHCRETGGSCSEVENSACDKTKNNCPGICKGGPLDGSVCYLPMDKQKVCDLPESDSKKARIVSYGITYGNVGPNISQPRLRDGIAFGFYAGSTEEEQKYIKFPKGYTAASANEVEFAINYFDKDKAAKKIIAVVDGKKIVELEQWAQQSPTPSATRAEDSKYYGDIFFKKEDMQSLGEGCHKYIFLAEDGFGNIHTFPEFGSLGYYSNNQGKLESRRSTNYLDVSKVKNGFCNSYYPDRPALEANILADVKTKISGYAKKVCKDGLTRSCYTADHGHLGHGACQAGTERCVDGRWSGTCEGQVLPKLYEVCDEAQVDENCNGFVNEGCPLPVTNTQNPADPATTDGASNTTTDAAKEGCGCSSTGNSGPVMTLLFGLLGIGLLRRRRE